MAITSNNRNLRSNNNVANSFLSGLNQLTTTQTASTAREDRPEAKLWINIGYVMPTQDDDVFVSIPLGIALDTMQPIPLPKRQGNFRALRVAQNALLEQLQTAGAQLSPGEYIRLPAAEGSPLMIEIRRVGEEEGITTDDQALVMDMGLFPK